ncbi:MAG: SMC-Scp complex subunit ScpB [Gammaproteobacteria bacterium]|nr:SMC-Scp complex subunit ScpB [Gammaproteobacteria bacterium]
MSEDTQKAESIMETKQIIEGLLMAAGKPLPMNKIAEVFTDKERPEPDQLKAALKEIESDCEARGFELKKVGSGYRFQVKQQYSEWVGKLWDEKPQRYSRALLETISIIAYRQPVTRGEIEKIRGVAVSTNIIRTLLEREWVRIVGHRDVPGRPAMYATTKQFLDYFNLKSLDELPPLSDIRDMEDLAPELSLEEVALESRVLDFPSAEDQEDDFDVMDEEEELAAAIGTRPIEEILGIEEEPEELEEDWDDEDSDSEFSTSSEASIQQENEQENEQEIEQEIELEKNQGSEESSEQHEQDEIDQDETDGEERPPG